MWLSPVDVLPPLVLAVLSSAEVSRFGLCGKGGCATMSRTLRSARRSSPSMLLHSVVDIVQVVLASGEIVNANKHTNTDLFKVLKGGSNNFGIVTRIDLPTFEQQKLWGGHVTYPFSSTPQHLRALVGFANDLDHDSDPAAIVSLWYSSEQGHKFVTNSYEYTKPVERPAIFQKFLAVPGNFSDSTRFTYVRGLAEQFEEKLGLR